MPIRTQHVPTADPIFQATPADSSPPPPRTYDGRILPLD